MSSTRTFCDVLSSSSANRSDSSCSRMAKKPGRIWGSRAQQPCITVYLKVNNKRMYVRTHVLVRIGHTTQVPAGEHQQHGEHTRPDYYECDYMYNNHPHLPSHLPKLTALACLNLRISRQPYDIKSVILLYEWCSNSNVLTRRRLIRNDISVVWTQVTWCAGVSYMACGQCRGRSIL